MDSLEYDKMYQLEESNWWYAGRRDLVLKMADKLSKAFTEKPMNILDAGCGTGINLKYFQTIGDSVGLDISEDALGFSRVRRLPSLVCGSVDRLPFKSKVFDLVLALDVIEHIEDDSSAISEFYRVLRPGGSLIVTVPAFMSLWSDHDLAVHHKRRYALPEVRDILQSGGFRIERASYWNFFLFLPVFAIRRITRFSHSEPKKRTDLVELPPILNDFLLGLLKLESRMIRLFDLPIGISIICICKKD
jgi:ubiquinone/menaquinone biosynthesis C-methylase UbiE